MMTRDKIIKRMEAADKMLERNKKWSEQHGLSYAGEAFMSFSHQEIKAIIALLKEDTHESALP